MLDTQEVTGSSPVPPICESAFFRGIYKRGGFFFSRHPDTPMKNSKSVIGDNEFPRTTLRTGKEIRFRFGSSEDKAGKEAKRRPTGW